LDLFSKHDQKVKDRWSRAVARNTRSPEYIAHLIDKLRGEKKPASEAPESG
jgi:hypothetical protein